MFHEMTLKLYFMKCSEREISQCILPLTLINDLVLTGKERTATHTQSITESIVNNEEDVGDKDSSSTKMQVP